MQQYFINRVSWRYMFSYFRTGTSITRIYQNEILEKCGPLFQGEILELGGEKHYNHARFFKHAGNFVVTNIGRDHDQYLDITQMNIPDNSVDNFVAVSMLMHVPEVHTALCQMRDKLKPGGRLLILAVWGHPVCDTSDYWRIHPDVYRHYFKGFEVEKEFTIGNRFTNFANALQRPKGSLFGRFLLFKLLGFVSLLLSRVFSKVDTYPIGYAVLLRK